MAPMGNNRHSIYKWRFQKAYPARLMLLLMPIVVVTVPDDESGEDHIIMIPLTAPVNGRDVTLTRIMDATIEEYIQYSSSHVLFGSMTQDDRDHDIVGVFNRSYCQPQLQFSTTINFLYLKEKITMFLSTLSVNKGTCMKNPTEATRTVAQNAEATEGTTTLLCFFLSCLQYCFSNFDKEECFDKLNRAVHEAVRIFPEETDRAALLLRNDLVPVEIVAIINFQIYIYPCMCAIMDANHRSMRVYLDMIGCSRELYSIECPGFKLCRENTATDSACNPMIVYHFYDLKDSSKSSSDYSVAELQYVSKNQSDQIEHSRVQEFCFLVQAKCHNIMEVLREEDATEKYSLMAETLKKYLQITRISTVRNAQRDNEESYQAFRNIKTKLRNVIQDEFYPWIVDVKSEYVKGVTYAEKFDNMKKQSVFPTITPNTDCLLYAFLVMDNIFVPGDITAFTQMLHRSYMGDHGERSEAYGLEHSKLWDSQTIWRYFNKFIVYLTILMKEKTVVKILPSLSDFADITNDSLLRQKLGHTCQQYAFYVGLIIASEIGLFPLLTNAEWKAAVTDSTSAEWKQLLPSSETIEKYNVFSYLLYLFGVSGKNEKEKTRNAIYSEEESSSSSMESSVELSPLQMFSEEVLVNYLLPMYHSVKNKIPTTSIPVGYDDFIRQGHGEKVMTCVGKLISDFPLLNANFRTKLGKQDNVLTKTKIRKPKEIKDDDVETDRGNKKKNKKDGETAGAERIQTLPEANRKQDVESVQNGVLVTFTNGTSSQLSGEHELRGDIFTFSASEDQEDLTTNVTLHSPFLLWLHERKLLLVGPKTTDLDTFLSSTTGSIIIGAFVESIFRKDELLLDKALLLQIMILRQFQKCGHKPIFFVTTKELDGIRKVLQKFLAIDEGDNIDPTTTDAHLIHHQKDQFSQVHHNDFSTRVTLLEALQFQSMKQCKASLTIHQFHHLIASAGHVMQLSDANGLQLLFGMDDEVPTSSFVVDCYNAVGNSMYEVMLPRLQGMHNISFKEEEQPSAENYWQNWRNAADEDVSNFLALYTDIAIEDVDALTENMEKAKRTLADNATEQLFGKEVLECIHKKHGVDSQSVSSNMRVITTSQGTHLADSQSVSSSQGSALTGKEVIECSHKKHGVDSQSVSSNMRVITTRQGTHFADSQSVSSSQGSALTGKEVLECSHKKHGSDSQTVNSDWRVTRSQGSQGGALEQTHLGGSQRVTRSQGSQGGASEQTHLVGSQRVTRSQSSQGGASLQTHLADSQSVGSPSGTSLQHRRKRTRVPTWKVLDQKGKKG